MTEKLNDVVTHEEIMQMNQQSWDVLSLMSKVIQRIDGSGTVTLTLQEYGELASNVKSLQKALLEITRLNHALTRVVCCQQTLQLDNEDAVQVMKELAKVALEGTEKEHWASKVLVEELQSYKNLLKEEV